MLRLLPLRGKTNPAWVRRKPDHLGEHCAVRHHPVGKDAKLIAPYVSDQCFNDALLLELNYLKEDLASNAGDRSDKAFIHNAYAVLTACRILYSARNKALVSKDQASAWAMERVPLQWRPVIQTA